MLLTLGSIIIVVKKLGITIASLLHAISAEVIIVLFLVTAYINYKKRLRI